MSNFEVLMKIDFDDVVALCGEGEAQPSDVKHDLGLGCIEGKPQLYAVIGTGYPTAAKAGAALNQAVSAGEGLAGEFVIAHRKKDVNSTVTSVPQVTLSEVDHGVELEED